MLSRVNDDVAKQTLSIAVQKKKGKPLSKGEIKYTTKSVAEGFQSVVELTVLDGRFEGEAASDKKTAEINAAQKALEFLAQETALILTAAASNSTLKKPVSPGAVKTPGVTYLGMNTNDAVDEVSNELAQTAEDLDESSTVLEPLAKKPKVVGIQRNILVPKPVGESTVVGIQPNLASTNPANLGSNSREDLNVLVAKIFRTNPGDKIVMKSIMLPQFGGFGYQCSLRIPELPGYTQVSFTGEIAENMRDAETSAAGKAVQAFNADKILQELIAANEEIKKLKKVVGRDSLMSQMAAEAARPLGGGSMSV